MALQSAIAPSPSTMQKATRPRARMARVGRTNATAVFWASASTGSRERATESVRIAQKRVTPRKCGKGAMLWEATIPPASAPMRPQRLQQAWNEFRIGRPYRRSTATPCAFIATSIAPLLAPKRTRVPTRIGSVGASASRGNIRQRLIEAMTVTGRLPKRAAR